MCALTFLPNNIYSGSTLRRRASNPITANNLGFYAYKYKYIHTYIHLCLKIIFYQGLAASSRILRSDQ